MENKDILRRDLLVNEINDSEDSDVTEMVSELIDLLMKDVYNSGSFEGIKHIEEKIENPELWKEIQHKVCSETDFYVKTYELKKVSEENALEIIKSAYEYRYKDYENDDYICEQLSIDKNVMKAIRCVFNYCEFAVILQKISKRRFRKFFVDKAKFTEEVMESIWCLFDENRVNIESLVNSRHLADLEMKVNYLLNGQDELKEEIGFLQFLVMEINDVFDVDLE